jgi:hypothetical protein
MKYLVACLFGLLVGASMALAVVYFDPLTMGSGGSEAAARWVLDFSLPDHDTLAFTHGGRAGLPKLHQGSTSLWEGTIASSTILTTALNGEEGPVALGTRISVPSESTDLLLNGVIVDDFWLISAPGRGSLFAHVQNNIWPLIKENTIPVTYLRQPWSGASVYRPTLGPGSGKRGAVYGINGVFADVKGSISELYRLNAYSREAGIEELDVELSLDVADPDRPDALSDAR